LPLPSSRWQPRWNLWLELVARELKCRHLLQISER
jgi:hypothetical protein